MVDGPHSSLVVGVLSLSIAALSLGIHELTGAWPSDLGRWGVVLFVLVGIGFVGTYLLVDSHSPSLRP